MIKLFGKTALVEISLGRLGGFGFGMHRFNWKMWGFTRLKDVFGVERICFDLGPFFSYVRRT